jgi:hypothetical protein
VPTARQIAPHKALQHVGLCSGRLRRLPPNPWNRLRL